MPGENDPKTIEEVNVDGNDNQRLGP